MAARDSQTSADKESFVSENSLLRRVIAAAEERQLLQNTLTAYKCPKASAAATAGCLALDSCSCDMSSLVAFISF